MTMRKSVMEKLRDLKRKHQEPVTMSLEDLLLLLLDPSPKAKRQANPTQRAFIYEAAPFKAFMGAKGSAKTSAGCAAGWLRLLLQPGSKGLVARRDYNDLKQTTKLRMEEMLARLPKGIMLDRSKDPPETWYIQAIPVTDAEGNLVDDTPSQVTFMGMDAMEEGGSYEFDWAFIDEASEVSERSVHAVNGLMRNMPQWWGEGEKRYCTMMAFNPTDTFHWLYTACTGMNHEGRKVREPWVKLYTPVVGENQRNLPSDYYERLAATMPEDMRERLVHGRWGATFEGAPVYREFRYDLHTAYNLIARYDPYSPLFRFWDFGYNHPFVIWAQLDAEGRLLRFREKTAQKIEIGPFVELAMGEQAKHFPNHKGGFIDYGDPAARQRKDTGSTLTELGKRGITLMYKISTIEEGIRLLRQGFERVVNGEALHLFDREGCPILINGYRGGYHLDDRGQKPVKDGFYDHGNDADRYGCVNVLGGHVDLRRMADLPSSIAYDPDQDPFKKGDK